MSKIIPTAEKLYNDFYNQQQKADTLDGAIWEYKDDIIKMMNNYAKLHVQAALEAVSRKQYFIKIPMEYAEGEGCIIVDEYEKLDQWYLPDMYPLENIK